MAAKLELARWIVTRSHGEEAAAAAEAHFDRVVREREAPSDVPEVAFEADGELVHLPPLLRDWFALGSTSEARRIVEQGGLRIDGEVVQELDVAPERLDGALVQAGKRRFARVFRRGAPA
jgi:tyrosyl-tRNA synthetase